MLDKQDTDEQRNAINDNARFVSILASAGSGKTRTLVKRVVREISEFNTSPEEIIAFTFTNKAADKLKAKIYSNIADRVSEEEFVKLFVGTIHGFCNDFLKKLDKYYNFEVLDDMQLEALVYRLYDELELGTVYPYSFVGNIQRFIRDYEVYENELLDIQSVPESIRKPIQKFCNLLYTNRMLTFGSMIRYTYSEIEELGGLKHLKHLFVDEYQDINPAQELLIKAMVQQGSKLTVVGDDLQSIYQWRGSDISRIISFEDDWGGETHVLPENFRSRADIVIYADRFAKTIEPRFKAKNKTMKPVKDERSNQNNIFWAHSQTEQEQIVLLGDLVEKAIDSGYELRDIAILLRSVKRSAPGIIRELEDNRDIRVYCPQISVVEGSIVNDMFIPLFKLISQPEPRNENEEREQDKVFNQFLRAYRILQPERTWYNKGLGVSKEWRTAIHQRKASAYNIRCWLYKFLKESKIEFGEESIDLLVQMGVLTRTIRAIEETNRRNIRNIRRKMPRHIYLNLAYILESQAEETLSTNQITNNVNAVFISTIHQAKGLEWPIVFLPSVTYRRFPILRRGHGTSFPDSVAGRYGTTEMDEKRLFYVAVTRAKDHLVLQSFPNDDAISPFLCENLGVATLSPIQSREQLEFERLQQSEAEGDEIASIGLSDLLMLMECPFQYSLRRVYSIYPQVGDELGYGRSLHEIIQRSIENGHWKSKDEIVKIVDEHTFIPLEGSRQLQVHKDSIKNQVLALSRIDELAQINENEIPIRFYIGSVEITGIIDSYTENMAQEITLIDWKTSIHDSLLPRYKKQMLLYAYALDRQKIKLAGASLIDVKQTAQSGSIASIPIDLSEEHLNYIERQVKNEIQRLKSLEFDAYPSQETCTSCDVKDICQYRWERDA